MWPPNEASNDNDRLILLHPAKLWLLALERQGVETYRDKLTEENFNDHEPAQ